MHLFRRLARTGWANFIFFVSTYVVANRMVFQPCKALPVQMSRCGPNSHKTAKMAVGTATSREVPAATKPVWHNVAPPGAAQWKVHMSCTLCEKISPIGHTQPERHTVECSPSKYWKTRKYPILGGLPPTIGGV